MDSDINAIISRINVLWHKKKTAGLTKAEEKEQERLRKSYLKIFRQNMRAQLDNIRIKEQDGSISPLKKKGGGS